MSEWTGDVQTRIEAGEAITVFRAVHIKPRAFANGQIDPVGFTNAQENFQLTVSGELRTYLAAGDAIGIQDQSIEIGLNIQGQRVSLGGLNEAVDNLQRQYDLNQAPLDVHDLAFSAGMQFLGYRQKFVGFVDGSKLDLNDVTGEFEVIAVSKLRQGTRKFDALLNAARDPIFQYVDTPGSDRWG